MVHQEELKTNPAIFKGSQPPKRIIKWIIVKAQKNPERNFANSL